MSVKFKFIRVFLKRFPDMKHNCNVTISFNHWLSIVIALNGEPAKKKANINH